MKVMTAVILLAILICFLTASEGGTLTWIKALKSRLLFESRMPFCSPKCNDRAPGHGRVLFPSCSCSRSCAVFGDCCYDSPHRYTELWRQYEFVCIYVMQRSGYRAVSNCPPGLFTYYSQNCERNLGLLPPVTSSQTSITYANLYCAQCNGDADHLTEWNVDLSCPSIMDDAMFSRYNTLEYGPDSLWMKNTLLSTKRQCKFKVRNEDFRTIDGLEVRPCVSNNKISKCSSSWKDPVSAKECASYEDAVFLETTAFRNPHCAHCNYVNLSYVECMPTVRLVSRRPPTAEGRSYTFSRVFNVHHSEKSCPEGEKYDPFTSRCRTVRRRRKNFV